MRELTEDEVLSAIQSCGRELHGRVALTYESGPYDIDRPTLVADKLARAIQRKFCEANDLTLGVKTVAAPHKVTDAEIAAWVERHDLGSLKGSDARCAFEDAESHHLTRGVAVVDGQTFSHTDADAAQQEGEKK